MAENQEDQSLQERIKRLKEKRDQELKSSDWGEVGERIAQAISKYGAARAGLKSGVNLSQVDPGPGKNWDAARTRAFTKYVQDSKDAEGLGSKDPDSAQSRALKTYLGSKYPGVTESIKDWDSVSAHDLSTSLSPIVKGLEAERQAEIAAGLRESSEKSKEKEREVRRQEAQSKEAERRADKEAEKEEKRAEKLRKRTVPGLGIAATEKDATDLKKAKVVKANMIQLIDDMVALREEKGAEVFDREAVSEGKSLAKDLMLQYKELAELGAITGPDMEILQSIVPDDPLEYSAASLVGQDPIMTKLKNLKQQTLKKYDQTLKAKLEEPESDKEQETKRVGDVTYRKVEGGWVPVK